MERNKRYIVYRITNTINNKEYIGAHSTYDINDDYMGSGSHLKLALAIKEYKFEKEILHEFDSEDEMYEKEKELVDQEYVERQDTYNLTIGGKGGWAHTHNCPKRKKAAADSLKGRNGFKNLTHSDEYKKRLSIDKSLDLREKERRIHDYNQDDKSYGMNSRLCKLWGISSQQASRWIKSNCL
jgi:hypothetical protein